MRPLTAVRKYRGQEQDPFTAGRELEAEAVLDGYIRRRRDRTRVTVRLLRVGDQKQLWTGQFDEEATDIFAVQDSIAEEVARQLTLELTSQERELLTKRYTSDAEAYELYLRGRFFWSQSRLEPINKAIGFFQEAIRKDPNYALAYSGLADCYRNLPISSDLPSGEAFPKAEAALRALEIDAGLAEAHNVFGWIHLWYGWDWAAAQNRFQRSLALDPNYIYARVGFAHLLSDLGRHEEALNEADRALRVDPISVWAAVMKGHFLYQARRYGEAIDLLRRALELEPAYWVGHITLGKNYERVGRYEDALEAFRRADEFSASISSEPLSLIGYTYAASGRRPKAERELRKLMAISRDKYVPPYYVAMLHHGLGNSTEAMQWLERAYADRDVHMVFLGVDAKWDGLRSDPRFIRLVKRLNFPT